MKPPRRIYFAKGTHVPNSTLPVLLFRRVLPEGAGDTAERFRQAFRKNGWVGLWTDSIYDYTHFHSNAHEVLGIAEGQVTLQLGGEDGRRFRLKGGDMLVLPAGTGHCRAGSDEGLRVIGAYPRGQLDYDISGKAAGSPTWRCPRPIRFMARTDRWFGSGPADKASVPRLPYR